LAADERRLDLGELNAVSGSSVALEQQRVGRLSPTGRALRGPVGLNPPYEFCRHSANSPSKLPNGATLRVIASCDPRSTRAASAAARAVDRGSVDLVEGREALVLRLSANVADAERTAADATKLRDVAPGAQHATGDL
jgi:hypothetical protein